MAQVQLRPVAAADEPFLLEVYASTREAELALVPWEQSAKDAFIRSQFTAQSRDYATNYPHATHDVVLVDEVPAGRFWIDRRAHEIHVLDIALLPEFRGRGVGASLLGDILAEAAAKRDGASIYVERTNRALTLYERLGFGLEQADEGGIYLLMRAQPQTAQANTAS